ncbi:MAG: glycosyltransferase family 4 protein [Bacillota bacterium]
MSKLKLLLIGPLPPPLGGATVLFKLLTEELAQCSNCEFYVINSNINKSNPFAIFKLLYMIYAQATKVDVVNLHASYRGIVVLAPFVFLISRLLNKKLIFRLFGGDFSQLYRKADIISRFLYDQVLFKADLVLFETQALVRKFSSHGNVRWFPNHRKITSPPPKIADNMGPLRVIFVSHVRKEKGIFELIEASKKLPGVCIDIYGPFFDGLTSEIFEGSSVKYMGIMPQDMVKDELLKYDVMILPSYKEGYPGVIIEAFIAGLAIVCTNLDTLKEMVTANEEAILVNPKNADEVVKALSLLDNDRQLLKKLKNNSLKKSELYNSQYWVQKYLSYCQEILSGCGEKEN